MKKKKFDFGAYAFLLPALIIYLSVMIVPICYSLIISLHDWNGVAEMKFVGLGNYIKLLTEDETFWIAVKNNLIWIVLTICVTMTAALGFAVVLNQKFRGRTVFRALFYFPCVVASITVAIIWRWIYHPNIGFINQLFKALDIGYKQTWISRPDTSLYAVFAASLWQGIGGPMLLFLAGLAGVPEEILEAATIDGANSVQKFFRITVPMMKQTFVIVIATLVTAALKVFDSVQGLTGGGPNNATQMLGTYMYSQTFQYNNVGMGTAVACIMVFLMMLVIVPYVSFTAKEQ